MSEREKVIKGLEICLESCCTKNGIACPYFGDGDCDMLKRDALELLKEQEPVEPITDHGVVSVTYRCGNCKTHFYLSKQKYCAICGRKVKWDESC